MLNFETDLKVHLTGKKGKQIKVFSAKLLHLVSSSQCTEIEQSVWDNRLRKDWKFCYFRDHFTSGKSVLFSLTQVASNPQIRSHIWSNRRPSQDLCFIKIRVSHGSISQNSIESKWPIYLWKVNRAASLAQEYEINWTCISLQIS